MQVIVYKNGDGVAIIYPTQEGIDALGGIDELAKRDVPTGKPYAIMEHTDLPTDRSQRDAWTVDVNDLTDGVGE